MKQNIKQGFETLAIAIVCTVWVLSMHQSCSELSGKFSSKKTNTNVEQKKVQELKTDTIASFKLEQRTR